MTSSENPYRAPKCQPLQRKPTRRFQVLAAWTIGLFIPVFLQLGLLQTSIFAHDFAPLIFAVACFVYLMLWRHYCRASYQHGYSDETNVHERHPMIARMSALAFVAALIFSTVFLGVALITATGPGDHPVIWLLFATVILVYKELIVAYAVTFARAADEGRID